MQINISLESPIPEGPASGPIMVGWLLNENKNSIIYDPPTRVRSVDMNRTHAKSALCCPAVINLESRYFEIKCPFDLSLGFVRDDKGKPNIKNLAGEASPIRNSQQQIA